MKVLMPPAIVLFLIGTGKLIYDVTVNDFKVAGNTLVVLGIATALAFLGMLADLLVHLNKKRHDVIPATAPTPRR